MSIILSVFGNVASSGNRQEVFLKMIFTANVFKEVFHEVINEMCLVIAKSVACFLFKFLVSDYGVCCYHCQRHGRAVTKPLL